MALDKEDIQKRMSQIEQDIDQMNQMIDENLQISDESVLEDAKADGTKVKYFNEVAQQEQHDEDNESMEEVHEHEEKQNEELQHEITEGLNISKTVEEKNESSNKKATGMQETYDTESSTIEKKNEDLIVQDESEAIIPDVPSDEEIESGIKYALDSTVSEEEDLYLNSEEPESKHSEIALTDTENITIEINASTDTAEDNMNADKESSILTFEEEITRTSSPIEVNSPIVLPKNNEKDTSAAKPITPSLRRTTNPFRVISVGSNSSTSISTSSSRHSSGSIHSGNIESKRLSLGSQQTANLANIDKLQKRQEYLTLKCIKLQKEINYLSNMNNQGMLSLEDSRKLTTAIERLQEYLDKKTKEKYEVGVLLSRQLRKGIDRGENGQFWIGNK